VLLEVETKHRIDDHRREMELQSAKYEQMVDKKTDDRINQSILLMEQLKVRHAQDEDAYKR
jgi:hypothetical protein